MTRTASDANDNLSRHDARPLHLVRVATVAAVLSDPEGALALLDIPDAELGRLFKIRLMQVAGLSTALNIDLGSIRGQGLGKASRAKRGSIRQTAVRHTLVAEGKLLRTSNFCAASRVSARKLSKDVAAGRIFSVEIEGDPYYPAFFLVKELDRKDLAKIVRRLHRLTGWSTWDFFTSPNMSLGNLTPLQALMHREVKQVLRVAEAFIQKYERGTNKL